MRGDKIYIVRSGRLFKVINEDDIEEMIRVVQNPSSSPSSAFGFYYDCVHGVTAEERQKLAKIVNQNPNYDRTRSLTIRSVIAQRVNIGEKILYKPGYKVGPNQYLCKSGYEKDMYDRLHSVGLMAHRVQGVGYDYNFGGNLYVIEWKKANSQVVA